MPNNKTTQIAHKLNEFI